MDNDKYEIYHDAATLSSISVDYTDIIDYVPIYDPSLHQSISSNTTTHIRLLSNKQEKWLRYILDSFLDWLVLSYEDEDIIKNVLSKGSYNTEEQIELQRIANSYRKELKREYTI